jgi:hypothetical protein
VFGLGLSLTVAPLTSTVLADADEHNAGVASGVNNAIARVASLVAIAAVGAAVAAQFGSALDDRVGGRELSQRAEATVERAKSRPLEAVSLAGVPAAERAVVGKATEDASVSGFRLAVGIAVALVALGGVLGVLGIQNPRREVPARDCAGGQLAGAPRDAARRPSECQPPAPQPEAAPS